MKQEGTKKPQLFMYRRAIITYNCQLDEFLPMAAKYSIGGELQQQIVLLFSMQIY